MSQTSTGVPSYEGRLFHARWNNDDGEYAIIKKNLDGVPVPVTMAIYDPKSNLSVETNALIFLGKIMGQEGPWNGWSLYAAKCTDWGKQLEFILVREKKPAELVGPGDGRASAEWKYTSPGIVTPTASDF